MSFSKLIWLIILVPCLAQAGVEQISEKEFKDLAAALSVKVNLFQEGWEQDPKAEFYGGTTRDYLYWLKGQFTEAKTHAEAEAVVQKLKEAPVIDVRDFIIGDSDVDIISAGSNSLNAGDFGVRKIDVQSTDILDPATELGKNEQLQGYIPAEKIRLARDGFHNTNLGDGIHEIYEGKLSVHFASAEDFAKSKYAKEGLNHPILLSLRYLRLQAINYFRTHGRDYPKTELLHAGLDPESARQVKALIEKAIATGELDPYLKKNKFKSWLNGAIQKSFRSYTNPTAALLLMKEFGVELLHGRYPDQIETLNQYVFTKYRDETAIAAALKKYRVNKDKFFATAREYFPDGKLYHGTKTEEAFRGIIFQGILPSNGGMAEDGLYGVSAANKTFSEEWGGDKNRLLEFTVKPDAKIVDITKGEGLKVWEATKDAHGGHATKFADLFGIDIVRYPYTPEAFVVKNASVLEQPQGVYRSIKSLSALIEDAKQINNVEEILDLISVNALTNKEKGALWSASRVTKEIMQAYLFDPANEQKPELLQAILETPYWRQQLPLSEDLLARWLVTTDRSPNEMNPLKELAWKVLLGDGKPSAAHLAFIDRFCNEESAAHNYGDVFIYLRLHGEPLPHSTQFAVSKFSRHLNSGYLDTKAADFLKEAHLDQAQLRELTDVYGRLDKGSWMQMIGGSVLLSQNLEVERVKADLFKTFKTILDADDAAPYLQALATQFDADPKLVGAVVQNLGDRFSALTEHSEKLYLYDLMPYYKLIPEVKELLFTELAHKNPIRSATAFDAIFSFPTDDHDLARIIQHSSFDHDQVSMYQRVLVVRKVGKESTKAFFNAVFRLNDHEPNLMARIYLTNYGDHGYLEQLISERLGNLSTLARLKPKALAAKEDEITQIIELMTSGDKVYSKELQLNLLSFFSAKSNLGPFLRFPVDGFSKFAAEDPAIAQSILDMLMHKNVDMDSIDAYQVIGKLIKRMPPSMELSEYAKATLQRRMHDAIASGAYNTKELSGIEEIKAWLAARPSHAIPTGCKDAYKLLGENK